MTTTAKTRRNGTVKMTTTTTPNGTTYTVESTTVAPRTYRDKDEATFRYNTEVAAEKAFRVGHGTKAIGDEAALLHVVKTGNEGWERIYLDFHWSVRSACNKMGWLGYDGRITKTGRAAINRVLAA